MGIWVIVYLITVLFAIPLLNSKNEIKNGVISNLNKTNKQIILMFSILSILFSGLRSGIGDTGYYLYMYSMISDMDHQRFFNYLAKKDAGFKILVFLLSRIFRNPQFFLIILSSVIIICFIIVIERYSENIGLSIILIVSTGIYVSSMNGVRQYLAASVLFLAMPYIIEGKWIKYFVLCIILSAIHTSAVIMIPLYFALRKKTWNLFTIFLSFIIIGIGLSYRSFVPLFASLLSDTIYSNYSEELLVSFDEGAHPIRFLVSMVPVILSFLTRKTENDEDCIIYRIYSNAAIISMLISFISLNNWIFARIGIYTSVFSVLSYPYFINRYFHISRNRIIIAVLIISLFFVYFLIDVKMVNYISYYLHINRELMGPLTRSVYMNL